MSPQPRQTRRALLGGALVLLLVVLAAGIFLLDNLSRALRSEYRITVVIPEAPGLVAGSPVWVAGRAAGTVSAVQFRPSRTDEPGALLLTIELPTDVQAQVRRDSDVRVTSERMIGDPVLDVLPGTAAAPALAPGDTLVARPRPTAEQVRRRAQRLRAQLDSLATASAGMGPLLDTRRASFARVQRHLEGAQREYGTLLRDVERSPALALLEGDELARVSGRLEQVLAELGSALAQQQERLQTSGAQQGMVRLRARADTLRGALAALQALMHERSGTLDRMSRDSALVHALARARTELDSLLAEVKRNPLRFAL